MLRLLFFLLLTIVLLVAVLGYVPKATQAGDLCTFGVEARGLELSGTRAVAEREAGFWFVRGVARDGQRWSCTLEETWWGLRIEDITIYE